MVKNLPASAGRDTRYVGLISGLGRSPGGGHGKPLQYSCLENPMDREAWRAAVHGATKLDTTEVTADTHAHTHREREKRVLTSLMFKEMAPKFLRKISLLVKLVRGSFSF